MARDYAVICATDPGAVEMEFYKKEDAEKFAAGKARVSPSEEYWVVEIKAKYNMGES